MEAGKGRAPRALRLAVAAACALALETLAGELQLVSRVAPEFPREAVQAGADRGHVKARMTVDGAGEVVRVEILEAVPRRVFDRAVVRTLSQWKFNGGAGGRHMEVDIAFSR
jgi:protein TonB